MQCHWRLGNSPMNTFISSFMWYRKLGGQQVNSWERNNFKGTLKIQKKCKVSLWIGRPAITYCDSDLTIDYQQSDLGLIWLTVSWRVHLPGGAAQRLLPSSAHLWRRELHRAFTYLFPGFSNLMRNEWDRKWPGVVFQVQCFFLFRCRQNHLWVCNLITTKLSLFFFNSPSLDTHYLFYLFCP